MCRDRRGGVHGVQGVARTHVLYPEPSVVGRDPCPPRAALSRPCWSDARANDHLHDHEDARDPPRHQAAASEWTGTNTKSGNRGRVQTFRGPTSELSPDTRVCTHRESPTFPPSLPTPAFYPPSHSSRPTPSDPDRLKWFVFDLTTTAAAVHGGTLFPPRTLPSFSVSRRMCGGVAPLPARYVCIYSFVDHLGTLARCTMQLRPRSFDVSSGGFGFLEDGTVERRKPAAMPLFAVATWLYCRRRRRS